MPPLLPVQGAIENMLIAAEASWLDHSSSPVSSAEEETHPVDLSSLSSKLLPGFTTLGFKDERRSKGKYSAGGWELSGAEGRLGCQWDAEIASFSFMIFFMWLGLDFKTNEV